LTAIGI
jgi:hypothetical protein